MFTMSLLVVILSYLLPTRPGRLNWDFFTKLPVSPTQESGGGLANAIVGSFKLVGWATLFAVPDRPAGGHLPGRVPARPAVLAQCASSPS